MADVLILNRLIVKTIKNAYVEPSISQDFQREGCTLR
jgi:hypothetical protein